MAEEKLIFALDIGTRSVIGLVASAGEGPLTVLDCDMEEYGTRAVVDGQIEDIAQTAKVASLVKERLEERLGASLKNVYIAAAGRVLKTQQAVYELELDGGAADKAFLSRLEAGAVRAAYDALFPEAQDGSAEFFCVGHSAVRYAVDDYEMSTILNHTGKRARVELIATFLPREVVESLYATMRSIGLTVAGLTLEPIAAMNAVIPPDIRKLNLALVDIGAGTSDIAVCDNGSVSAYTMATTAGDEITEALMRELLVDFQTAEDVKRALNLDGSDISYEDILGIPHQATAQEILNAVEPALDDLAGTICRKILEVNGKAPAAAFLTGGGSLVTTLSSRVAAGLSIDEKRVGVGGSNYMKKVAVSSRDVFGPEFATPVGIALTAAASEGGEAFSVTINGEPLHLIRNWNMTVLDALLLGGCQYSQIMGHVGKSLSYDLNGERKTVRGGLPRQAEVLLNGSQVALNTPVSPGDDLSFQPSEPGEDVSVRLSDAIGGWHAFSVELNGVETPAGDVTFVGGIRTEVDREICNLDRIETKRIDTLGGLLQEMGLPLEGMKVMVNGAAVPKNTPLHPGDQIFTGEAPESASLRDKHEKLESLEEAAPPAEGFEAATGEPPSQHKSPQVSLEEFLPSSQPQAGERPESGGGEEGVTILLNGRSQALLPKEGGLPHQFVDLFNYVDIDPKNPQGNIVLKLNGKNATYLETVRSGDKAEIYWDKSGLLR